MKRQKLGRNVDAFKFKPNNQTAPKIPKLNDDCLIHIFSFISDLHFKLQLELVCKRFRRLVLQPASWANNHSLAVRVALCNKDGSPVQQMEAFDNLFGWSSDSEDHSWMSDTTQEYLDLQVERDEKYHFYLNQCPIKLEQYPSILSKLLERMKVHSLVFEIGKILKGWMERALQRPFDGFFEDYALTPIFQKHASSLELRSVRFKRGNANTDALFYWLMEKSSSTLTELDLEMSPCFHRLWKEFCNKLPAAVRKCDVLESVAFHSPPYELPIKELSSALDGKPLKSLQFSDKEHQHKSKDIRAFLSSKPNSSEMGVTCLGLSASTGKSVRLLYAALNERAKPSLNKLVVYVHEDVFDSILPFVSRFALFYPNLEQVQVVFDEESYDAYMNEEKLLKTNFLKAASTVKRRVDLHSVRIKDLESFEEKLNEFAKSSGVDLKIEKQEQDKPIATLIKNNNTLVIRYLKYIELPCNDVDCKLC